MSAQLTIRVLPDGPERAFDGSRPVTVGRDPAADIVLTDPSASRRHAVAQWDPGAGWTLTDHSSTGVFLDGRRVGRLLLTGPMTLHLGSPTGGVRLHLVPAARPAPAVTLPPGAIPPYPGPAAAPPAAPRPGPPSRPSRPPPARWPRLRRLRPPQADQAPQPARAAPPRPPLPRTRRPTGSPRSCWPRTPACAPRPG